MKDLEVVRSLWERGLNDIEIARQVGRSANYVKYRRHDVLRLPPKSQGCPEKRRARLDGIKLGGGVPMEEALNPAECAVVRRFLRDLLRCANQRRPGWRFDLTAFLKEYRNTRVTTADDLLR